MKFYFSSPPGNNPTFDELFAYIWSFGLGRKINENGDSQQWTSAALEEAFHLRGYSISQRTIEYWQAKSALPSGKNIRALARIISDPTEYDIWLHALIQSVQSQKAARKLKTNIVDDYTPADHLPSDRPQSTQSWPKRLFIAVGFFCTVLVAGTVFARTSQPQVTELKICDIAHFSLETLTCKRNMQVFGTDTKKLYVSFGLRNVDRGEVFSRTWFLDGEKFLTKESRYIEPWEGWTWIGSQYPLAETAIAMAPGRYTLQVSTQNTIEVTSFTIL